MKDLPLYCEEESLAAMLRATGIEKALAWTGRDEQVDQVPILLLTWSARAQLLREPAWAWLETADTQVLQMPQPRCLLEQTLQNLSGTLPTGMIPARDSALIQPLGQFLWALDHLMSENTPGEPETFLPRLRALRKFALRHWRGRYEAALHGVEACRKEAMSKAQATLRMLRPLAVELTFLDRCALLVEIVEAERHSGDLLRIRTLYHAVCDELAEEEELFSALNESSSWQALKTALPLTEQNLNTWRQTGYPMDSPVSQIYERIRDGFPACERFIRTTLETRQIAADADAAVQNLADFEKALADLKYEMRAIHHRLHGLTL